MKIFGFVKKVFFIGLTILSSFTNANSLNAIPLSCISMNNQECKTRPQVVNVNGDEPVFFPFSIETSKCSGSCNNIKCYKCSSCIVYTVLFWVFFTINVGGIGTLLFITIGLSLKQMFLALNLVFTKK